MKSQTTQEDRPSYHGRHVMWVEEEANVFHIQLSGFFEIEDAELLLMDYEKHAKSLDKQAYNLVVDCIQLSVFHPDILPYLQKAYQAYAEFKGVHIINPPAPLGQLQLKRIARENDLLEHFHFVNSAADLKLL